MRGAEAVEEAIASRIAEWSDVPTAFNLALKAGTQRVRLPIMASIKTLLFIGCREMDVTRAELARRLDWHREQVDRLFRFDHATRIDQFDAAFRAIGKHLDIDLAA